LFQIHPPPTPPPPPPPPIGTTKLKAENLIGLFLAVSVGLFFFVKKELIQRFLWAIFWLVASCEPCKLYLNFQVQVSFFPFFFTISS
jgi:hypothetical protein